MKRIATVVVACLFHGSVVADYTGVTCESFVGEGWVENGYADLVTYRLYAEFDDPTDFLDAIAGSPGNNLELLPSGGVFHNSDFDSNTAPRDLRPFGIWVNQWDTYVTIGATDEAGDATNLSAGFGDRTDDLSGPVSDQNIGWFIVPTDEQGRAVDGRVLSAQLTVPDGDTVTGMFNVFVIVDGVFTEFMSVPFVCDPAQADCDDNGIPDAIEIEKGFSNDCDGNGVPDQCDGEPCLRGDLNCTGFVGFDDILLILQGWGPCEPCVADIDKDGRVGFLDLLYVLSHHGVC